MAIKVSRAIKISSAAAVLFMTTLTTATMASDGAKYDLWTMTSDHQVIIAVASHDDAKSYSVAAGNDEKALNILDEEAAQTSLATLRKRAGDHDLERILSHHSRADKKRIRIIQEEVIEANEAIGSGHNVFILEDENQNIDIEIAPHGESAVKKTIELDSDFIDEDALAAIAKMHKDENGGVKKTVIQTHEDGVTLKLVYVSGVDANAARRFIAQIEGLSDEARATMKLEIGL